MHERTGMAVFAYISPKDWSTREGCQAIYFFFCFYFCMEQAFPVFVPRYDSSHTYRHRSSNPMVCILECAAWASIAHVLDLNVLHHTHTHTQLHGRRLQNIEPAGFKRTGQESEGVFDWKGRKGRKDGKDGRKWKAQRRVGIWNPKTAFDLFIWFSFWIRFSGG